MKKILSAMLIVTMILSMSIVFAYETANVSAKAVSERAENNIIYTTGVIKELNKGQVRVAGEGAQREIILNIQDDTYILDAQHGTPILVKNLKKGNEIVAYYGPAVTKSIPPQGKAIALIVGTPKAGSAGMYMKVAKVQDESDGSIKVLDVNTDRLVTIKPGVFAHNTDITTGSDLVVWYDKMTMSLPAQAIATKVVLLPGKADIRVHTGAGTIVVNGKELALGIDDRIERNGNTIMLPLRVVAESLGYSIVWDDSAKTIELQNGTRTMADMTIGSKLYGRLKMAVQLDYAPQLVNGKTLVPVEFFTDVLKLKVGVNNGHI